MKGFGMKVSKNQGFLIGQRPVDQGGERGVGAVLAEENLNLERSWPEPHA